MMIGDILDFIGTYGPLLWLFAALCLWFELTTGTITAQLCMAINKWNEQHQRQKRIDQLRVRIACMEQYCDDDTCMCGDLMQHSPWAHGHQPVSQYMHYVHPLVEELRKLESDHS